MLRYVALVLWFALLAPAQVVTGTITGSVVDPTGSPIAGASVKLESEATAAIRTISTDAEGSFVFSAINPGFYVVTAENAGFKKLQKQHIELVPGDTVSVGNLKLEVGMVSESITVKAEGATIQTATSERAGIVTSQEITDLTVINRDFVQFAEMQPGIVTSPASEVQSFTGNTTINALGGRTTGNSIQIDGVPAGNSNQGNSNTSISLDATQTVEVKVANFQAEYGRSQGVTIMAVSKGGTQQYHGGAYWYKRHEQFNAMNFFNNRNGTAQTPYRITTAGGYIGGPVRTPVKALRNKLFFFLSSEEIRELRPKAAQNVTVPTALERKGDFSQSAVSNKAVIVKDPTTGQPFPGNVVPANRILQSTQNYLNLLPMPNFFNNAITNGQYNYIFQESLVVPKRLEGGRLDYNLSEKTIMYGRFNYWWEDQAGAAVSAGNASWGWLPDHYTAITPSGVAALTHIFNASTILQATLGFQRFTEAGSPLNEALLTARSRSATGVNIPQFHPEINPYNLVPGASFGGLTNAANPSYATRFPLRGVENTLNLNVMLNKTIGSHTAKVGFYGEDWRVMKGEQANFAGTMAFGTDSKNSQDTGYAYANALIGTLTSYTEASARPPMYEFTSNYEWYLQDSWKVTRKLTVDMGVRWGWSTPWHNNHNIEAGFVESLWDPNQAVKLFQPVTSGGQRVAQNPYSGAILPAVVIGAIVPDKGNPFNGMVYRVQNPNYPEGLRYTDGIKTMPRIGLAYDPFGRGKTVIRTGGGFFYSIHDRDNYQSSIQYNPPIQYNPTINYTTVQTFIGQAGYLSPSNISGNDPNRHIQRTYNYSFGIQQDIGLGMVLDVAYVGALGRHLLVRTDLNASPLGANFQPKYADASNGNKVLPSQFVRPYTGYGNIWYYTFSGNSSYHSLQTTVRRRYKGGLTYGVVWTWSKAMDYADDDASGAGQTVSGLVDPKIWNYGKAGFDRTHVFRLYWTYNVPKVSRLIRGGFVKATLDNWQLSGKWWLQSGAPTGIGSPSFSPSQDITGSTDGGRVLIVGDPILPKDQRTFNQAFNTAAIVAPPIAACQVANSPAICWGNAPKDVFRGPGYNNWDMSLFKNIPLYEKVSAQLRVEAYNVFNHTQFTAVNTSPTFSTAGVQTNTAFGQYTSAYSPRRLQLALRVTF